VCHLDFSVTIEVSPAQENEYILLKIVQGKGMHPFPLNTERCETSHVNVLRPEECIHSS